MRNENEFDDLEQSLPETLRFAMRDRSGSVPAIPSEVDRAILADARRHLAMRVRLIRRRRWSGWQFAAIGTTIAAASIIVFAWLPGQTDQSGGMSGLIESSTLNREARDGDVDGNGRVDILDAFVMAREIRSGRGQIIHDVNGDGQLDQADINEIAQRAVML